MVEVIQLSWSDAVKKVDHLTREVEGLRQQIERVRFALGSKGDPERSEFHRGWHSCCEMIEAAMRPKLTVAQDR